MDISRPVCKAGISEKSLKISTLLFLLSGALGKGIFENILVKDMTLNSQSSMGYATAAIALQGLSFAAVPMLAFFTVRKAEKEKSMRKLILHAFFLAFLLEIPYDLLYSGRLFYPEKQNPAFALVLSSIVLWAFERYIKNTTGIMIKTATSVAAVFWAAVFSSHWGACIVLLCITMRIFWKKESLRLFSGAIVIAACSIFSPLYMLSPISLILLGFFKEQD